MVKDHRIKNIQSEELAPNSFEAILRFILRVKYNRSGNPGNKNIPFWL